MCLILSILLLLSAVPAFAAEDTAPKASPFENGDKIALFGSSSTSGGLYTGYLYMYYATHFPNVEFELVNFGCAGDSSVRLLEKMDRDLAYRPDINKAYVMIGANDGSDELFAGFEDRLTKILTKLKNTPTIKEVVVISITHYDDIGSKAHQRTVDISEIQKKVAKKLNLPYADAMSKVLPASIALKADDPTATFIPDGVHPDSTGHMLTTTAILEAQGLLPVNGKDLPIITVDLEQNAVTDCKNATATAVTKVGNTWEFTYTADRLPFPIMGGFDIADKYSNFGNVMGIHDLLQFTGLKGSNYALKIDGTLVGNYTAAQLLRGLDLAAIEDSPIQERSKILRRKAEAILRTTTGYMLRGHVGEFAVLGITEVNPSYETIEAAVKKALAEGKTSQGEGEAMLKAATTREADYKNLMSLHEELFSLAKNRTFKVTLTQISPDTPAKTFADTESHWGKPYILPLAQQGIINGKGTDVFDPDGNITRAEFMTLALKVGSITATAGTSYPDVVQDAWFANTIATAKEQNLIPANMVADGNFYPDQKISREEMTAVLTALYESQKLPIRGTEINHFTDRTSIEAWAVAPISTAVALGLVAGNPDGSFNPKGNATRAEAAVIMSRLQKLL